VGTGQGQRLDGVGAAEAAAAEAAAAAATLGIHYNFMRYRQGYPGEALDDRQLSSNIKFYRNEIKSAPDGTFPPFVACGFVACGAATAFPYA
jgi:hypothetical protein